MDCYIWLIFSCYLISTTRGDNGDLNGVDRIVGGTKTALGEFPWLVSLQVKSKDKYVHNCGGAIVSPCLILTAAHCVNEIPKDELQVFAGNNNLDASKDKRQIRKVNKIKSSNYDPDNYENDIALLVLEKPLKINNNCKSVCIAKDKNQQCKDNSSVTISGWGKLKEGGKDMPKIAQKVNLTIIEYKKCNQIMEMEGYEEFMHNVTCTYNEMKDTCQGDSGGPLTSLDNKCICGVVSWGIGCARKDKPGIYTNVPAYSEWILKTIDTVDDQCNELS